MNQPNPQQTEPTCPAAFVEVAVDIPSDRTFTYAIPPDLHRGIAVGCRVLVTLGQRRTHGFIIGVSAASDVKDPKFILGLPDAEPLFDEEDLSFFRWIADYYLHPLGRTLAEILPPPARGKRETVFSLQCPEAPGACLALRDSGGSACRRAARKTTGRQEAVIAFLRNRDTVLRSELLRLPGASFAVLAGLLKRGCLAREERSVSAPPPPMPHPARNASTPPLNPDQQTALARIRACLATRRFAPILLHGVTGSGKTEVYLHAMETVLAGGGGVLCLVPEIALTPQFLARVRSRFPDEPLAVIHSGIAETERYDQWRRIRRGEIRVAVGARSALFAPVRNLRLVVVDEEHDPSYKQDERLRYNARDLAVVKAKRGGAVVLLGSATPSVQTWHNTAVRGYERLILPRRVQDRPLPEISVVDLRKEASERADDTAPVFSGILQAAVSDTLRTQGQVLLFLNRRGFHPFVVCLACGQTLRCRNCDIALTYHEGDDRLRCHCCDYSAGGSSPCPACGSLRIRRYGVGTERVEREARRLFPGARIGRMDSDTTIRRGSHERILATLENREIDILVGTQMITKGHDFPHIALVGVICADTSLNLPDYTSAERTFQLLTQVAGRPGRGDRPGKVVIQTFHPGHYAIGHAREHDPDGFVQEELAVRRELAYPPFSRLVALHMSSPRKNEGKEAVERIGRMARAESRLPRWRDRVEVLGPAESPIPRIRGRHRWQILMKGRNSLVLRGFARWVLAMGAETPLQVRVDVDPVHFS